MSSTRTRTFVKSMTWETFSFVLTVGISYPFTGTICGSIGLAAALFVLKVSFLFGHERTWKQIQWGKF